MIKSFCINCGSSSGILDEYRQMASLLGKILSDQKIKIIYGDARVGLMGAVADASIQNGGEVIGIIPKKLAEKVKHDELSKLIIVETMHERKQKMFELSDAFIALPGGFGTLSGGHTNEYTHIFAESINQDIFLV